MNSKIEGYCNYLLDSQRFFSICYKCILLQVLKFVLFFSSCVDREQVFKSPIDVAIILILTGNYLALLSQLLRKGGEDLRV